MATITLHQLGEMLRKRRGERGIREVSSEIGVSSATLSRVERGKLPDLDTFGKICRWMKLDPAEVLGVNLKEDSSSVDTEFVEVTVHFRSDKNASVKLARALAELAFASQKKIDEELNS